jgi:hypothetical protein
VKEATYRGSWKRRGGVGAFMMLARKWDRLEGILSKVGKFGGGDQDAPAFDIFRWIERERHFETQYNRRDGEDGTVLAEVRDLRRYLLLVEAEMVARGVVPATAPAQWPRLVGADPTDIYTILAAYWGVDREVAKKRAHHLSYGGGPGTPEDGGQHARRVDGQVAIEPPVYARLEDGLTERPPWPHIDVPWEGVTYHNADRRKFAAGDCDHLERLPVELNAHEWSHKVQNWYRNMYAWHEGPAKYILRPSFQEDWGVQP